MKKLFFVAALAIGYASHAQIYTPGTPTGQIQGTSGNQNVGIGNNSPQARLHIAALPDMEYSNPTPPLGITVNTTRFQFTNNSLGPTQARVFNIYQQAINEFGTAVPNTNLETFRILGDGSVVSLGEIEAISLRSQDFFIGTNRIVHSSGNVNTGFHFTANNKIIVGDLSTANLNLNPTGAYSMFVTDGIVTEEVVVKLKADWPDYVFKPAYRLMPLEELEAFIGNNQHLPNVPSANEVANEGQKLGENQKVLVEKVEELTLYLIQLNKELQAAQAKIEALEASTGSATAARQ